MLRKALKIEVVTLFLYKGKIFIPTSIQYDSGQIIDRDPVYECEINKKIILEIVEKILEQQKIKLPRPDSLNDLYNQAKTSILKTTKTSSWKKLASASTCYMLVWEENEVSILVSQLDKKGRYEFPNSLKRIFCKGTSPENLIEELLNDIEKRPGYE